MIFDAPFARHPGLLLALALLPLGGCTKKPAPINRGNPPPSVQVLRVELAEDLRAVEAVLRVENTSADACRIERFGLVLADGRTEWTAPKGLVVPAGGSIERAVRVRGGGDPRAAKAARGLEARVLARCDGPAPADTGRPGR